MCFLLNWACSFNTIAWAQPSPASFQQPNTSSNLLLNESSMSKANNRHEQLQSEAYRFIEDILIAQSGDSADIRIQVRDVDERIDIPRCASPFVFETNSNLQQQSNMSIKVTCNNTNWYLFMHANVAVIQQVVVTSENLSPGTLLSSSNIEVIEMDKNKLRGSTFSTMNEIVGARIKRRTRSGNVINDSMLCFVCKGDRVTIAAVSGGLSIKVYGVAEQDGVLGDTIQVRNISSDKLVFAKIASTSQVEINI
jgi:flagella basal body P-ring formation protein FlgA